MKVSCIVIGLLISGYTFACQCVARSLPDLFSEADVAFLGEVVNTTNLSSLEGPAQQIGPNGEITVRYSMGPTVWLIKPYQAFKNPWNRLGNEADTYRNIFVIQSGSNCDSLMQVKGKYLIFAKLATGSVYTTSQCAGTIRAADAESAVQKLHKLSAAIEDAQKP
jgi:hypothetical protein